jgi:hypothetical protein
MGFWDSMSGQEIYENFANAPGPDGLMQSQEQLAMVEAVYTERENQIRTLAASMEEGWTGDAAGAAQRGAGPLAVAHGGAAQEMATAKDLLSNQADSFYLVKSSVTPVPPAPNSPSTLDNVITLGSAQSDYEAGVAKSNAAAQVNVAAMDGWTSSSSYNGSMMPTTYGQIDPNAMNVGMTQPLTPPPVGPGPGGGDTSATGGGDPGGSKSGYPRSGSRNAIGSFDPNYLYQPPGTDGKTTPVDYKPVSTDPTPPGWPGGPGWQSGTGQGGSGGGQGSLSGTGFGAFGGGGSGSGSGSGSSAGSRLGGIGSSSGSSSGSAAGGEKSLGSGRGSGAAGAGAANETMGRGGAGAAGAKGAGGKPGGMGSGMGGHKGEGGEDEEHQRKYVMEDDDAFQVTENGERLIDPYTGLPITPPVIGQ